MTAGKQANKPAPNSIVDAALEALFAMLVSSKKHCMFLLALPTLVQDLSSVLSNLHGHYAGKMTAGACLARLCLIEMVESTDGEHVPTPVAGCYDPAVPLTHHFAYAVRHGVLDTVIRGTYEAILVSNLLGHTTVPDSSLGHAPGARCACLPCEMCHTVHANTKVLTYDIEQGFTNSRIRRSALTPPSMPDC